MFYFPLQNFIARNQSTDELPSPIPFGFKRFGLGALYMLGHLIGSGYVRDVGSENFQNLNFRLSTVSRELRELTRVCRDALREEVDLLRAVGQGDPGQVHLCVVDGRGYVHHFGTGLQRKG